MRPRRGEHPIAYILYSQCAGDIAIEIMNGLEMAPLGFLTFLCLILTSETDSAGTLDSHPSATGGVLTSCGANQLTCSHDGVAAESTQWRITLSDSSVHCQVTIAHSVPNPTSPYMCGEFVFENITDLSSSPSLLNSTGMVNTLPLELSGGQVECVAGALTTSPSVGNITFCIIGK